MIQPKSKGSTQGYPLDSVGVLRLGLYQVTMLEEEGFNVYFKGGKGAGTQKESQICYGQFISKLARKYRVLTEDVLGVPRVGIPRPSRASMQDLYNRMGRMEICQEAIEHIGYRQSYHWDRIKEEKARDELARRKKRERIQNINHD
nr:hypothetical protein [Tanacetum cinerariifolium]